MTTALVRTHTAGTSIASGTTVAATVVTADVAIGNVLVAWVGFDNLTITTPTVSSLSKMAGETNSWAKIASHDSSIYTASSGVRGEMWVIKTTVVWTVALAVTVTLSNARQSKCVSLAEYSGVSTTVRGTAGSGTDAGGNPTASTSGTALVAGDLVLGGSTCETNGAITQDADTTNGPWVGSGGALADTGADLSSVRITSAYKIITATGVQTFNPWYANNGDSGAVVVALVSNSAPNAPTLNTPATGTTIDLAVTNRFGLTFSDPDVGDSLSKLDLRYKLVGAGSWTTVTQTLPNAFYDFAPATFAAGNYEWQACTYDHLGLVGPYCASSFFTAASSPGVPSITAPTSGSTIGLSTATVTWSTPTQTDYQIRKMDDVAGVAGTTVYYDSGDVVDATTRSVTVAFPVNNRWEHIQVRTRDAGLWSSWADSSNDVLWTAPMVPTLTATAFSISADIDVVITNPAPTGGEPAVSYNDVYVSAYDIEYRAATLIPPNSTWTWKTPGAGRVYTIRVEAVGSNGTTSTSV